MHDGDEVYLKWVKEKLEGCGASIKLWSRISDPLDDLPVEVNDSEGVYILFAGEHDSNIESVQSNFQKAKVIDCTTPVIDNYFGNYIKNNNGEIVIARAFCPYIEYGSGLFPYARREPINDIEIDPSEIEGYLDLVAELDENVGSRIETEEPDWSVLISQFAESLDPAARKLLLIHFFACASSNYLEQNSFQSLGTIIDEFNVESCRLLIENALNNASAEMYQELLIHVAQMKERFELMR